MKIAISGSTGLIGQRLQKEFARHGWETFRISRSELFAGGEKLRLAITGKDALIHLSGAPILHRWTAKYKNEMVRSRVITTLNLSQAIATMEKPPRVFISTSAVGIYSDTGIHTEEKAVYADDFLGKLCMRWETNASAADSKTRVVIFRLGIVLAGNGGALKKMMLPFRMGLGGPIGNGRQYFSWVHIDDLAKAFVFALENKINGTFNLCSPQYLSNSAFSIILAKTLHRPSWLRIPGFALKLLYGEGASVLTSGQAAIPEKLLKEGFVFDYNDLQSALDNIINKKTRR